MKEKKNFKKKPKKHRKQIDELREKSLNEHRHTLSTLSSCIFQYYFVLKLFIENLVEKKNNLFLNSQ